ncbi:MAG: response regulator transcription factor [Proteobacteria bacterium]|nr:response regulator transcription factor [Pseudomonadota bacterium]
MRILVVEDDRAIASVLERSLKEESYAVDIAADGVEGEWLAVENNYDCIILDVMLPRKDGFAVLKSVREAGIITPVLMLTARDQTTDKVQGLDHGADDYLTKPFSLDELFARVRALLRRKQNEYVGTVVEVGHLKIDPARREVTRAGQKIDLTTKEYSLLEYLARNAGSVVTRNQLSEHVWDMNFEPNSNVVDVYIGYLRSKIDKGFDDAMIRTVRGHGYMLDLPGGAHAHP